MKIVAILAFSLVMSAGAVSAQDVGGSVDVLGVGVGAHVGEHGVGAGAHVGSVASGGAGIDKHGADAGAHVGPVGANAGAGDHGAGADAHVGAGRCRRRCGALIRKTDGARKDQRRVVPNKQAAPKK